MISIEYKLNKSFLLNFCILYKKKVLKIVLDSQSNMYFIILCCKLKKKISIYL